MDNKKFALDAFAQAQQASIEMEADYFHDYMQRRGEEDMFGAFAIAGLAEMSAIIEAVQHMGLEDAMHMYEKALICKAFHAGCQAGQLMKDTK